MVASAAGCDTLSGVDRPAPTGTLYVVALPIGNPSDVTLRAIEVLRGAAVVAAEDTRHFRTLARAHGISTPVVSYHDQNEVRRSAELLERLRGGEDVALVSDAGTPLVSDPGYRLVGAAIAAGLPVTAVPGPSAVTTALAASGLAPQPFRFAGFPPRTAARRRAFFAGLRDDAATLVLFEAPHRALAMLTDARLELGDRAACLARNLTKPHERYQRGTLGELAAALSAEGEVRGEMTIVVAGGDGRSRGGADPTAVARLLLADGVAERTVVALLTEHHGLRRREAYEIVLRSRPAR